MRPSIKWLKARPIAHRGLHNISQGVVENTQTAFARAIAENYTIECDLQISGDGEAMVFHDPDLDRLTIAKGAVNQLTAEQLKQVKFKDSDDKIQTLAELLHQTNGKVPLIIELKSLVDGDMRIAERAVEVLKNYKGDHALMSFGPMLMQAIRNMSPQTLRGGVAGPPTEELWLKSCDDGREILDSINLDFITYLESIDLDFLSYSVKGLPSNFVKDFRTPEKPVISWTIRDQKTADFALKYTDQITFEGFKPQ